MDGPDDVRYMCLMSLNMSVYEGTYVILGKDHLLKQYAEVGERQSIQIQCLRNILYTKMPSYCCFF